VSPTPTQTVTPTPTETTTPKPTEKPSNTTDWGIAKKTNGWLDIEATGENEIILGESTESIIGIRDELAAVAAVNAVLLINWELHLPEKWSLHNFHVETEMDRLDAHGVQTVTTAVANKITASKARVLGQVSQVYANRVHGMLQNTENLATDVHAVVERTHAVANLVQAQGAKVQAITDNIHATGVSLQTLGETMENAGTELSAQGTAIKEAGTEVTEQMGSSLESSGTYLHWAGVHLEGH